jgi:hypothetical protein
VTLRHALEDSRNVPAVRMMDALTPRQVVTYAQRFGLQSKLDPYLSLALGAADLTLLEMTSAFSVFPNGGVRMKPYPILKIADREGNVLEETTGVGDAVAGGPLPHRLVHRHARPHRPHHDQLARGGEATVGERGGDDLRSNAPRITERHGEPRTLRALRAAYRPAAPAAHRYVRMETYVDLRNPSM